MIDLGQAPPQQEERYHIPDTPTDSVEAFRNILADHGICPDCIDTSGKLVRVDIDRGDKAGWYVFFLGDVSAGSFGNWRTGLKEKWCSVDRKEMSDAESERYAQIVAEAKRQREALKAELQGAAKVKANEIWNQAQDTIAHAYLSRKFVQAHGLKQSRGDLIVPLRDEKGEIHNLQFIKPTGEKKFLFGGRVEGLSHTIKGNSELAICEGYATGATIRQATGATIICAFNRVNLLPVAKIVRDNSPDASITLCADNDRFTAGNPGLSDATKAAKAIKARVIYPVFDELPGGDDPEKKLTDFNDLAALGGFDLVKKQAMIDDRPQWQKGRLPPLTMEGTRVAGRLLARPAPLEFLFKFNDQGLIPRGVVGVIAATGGTGKTFFLLSLAMAGAGGGNFGPIHAPRPLKTLVLVGEDTQDELERRLWDIGRGKFPEMLHAASVYGEVGPLMRLEGSNPTLADAWYWLDKTLSNYDNLDLLIIDPKSRFYGLDENNNDHATQWIQSLEILAKKHDITILFSSHTGKQSSGEINQNMIRGGSAIVDGCRWQAGMIRMDQATADRLGIENARDYVMFDAPKSNYSPDLPSVMYFKRSESGVLEYCEPGNEIREEMADALLEILTKDTIRYSKRDLEKEKVGVEVARNMKEIFPGFRRNDDMGRTIDQLIKDGKLFEEKVKTKGVDKPKTVLIPQPF
ncbi:MAG: AAA family ATPase [Desulfocapsaceae bacterium]|nr:AAA family ATPase [Desulfocapsaceae bacterium]